MLALARSGAAEGSWLRAETQTAGRGRLGRGWQSPIGNLYASTIVRVSLGEPQPATLALVAVIALARVTASYAPGRVVTIKWPNDLMIGDAKFAGILLERADDAVVIGFGANLGFHPVGLDRPVTSFAALGLERPDPGHFCQELVGVFATWLEVWRNGGLAPIRAAWEADAHPRGTDLIVNLGDGQSMNGQFDGLEADGALRLRLADGSFRAIHAGDVFLL